MRIAYIDCFAGIAGDMFLGALIDAGVPAQVLHDATSALNIGASLKIERVDRSGISSTKVHVLEGARLAEKSQDDAESPLVDQESLGESTPYTRHPRTQHQHKTGHVQSHDHVHEPTDSDHPHAHEGHSPTHAHGRSLSIIRRLIQSATLDAAVKQTAIRAFELLGQSEAKIHNVDVDNIHFHEVGAVDAIVDIVAASAGIHHLDVGGWYCSPINVGGGTVVCAHGTFPVPAPATADLLRGMPTYSAHVQKELVTPTGAALLRALDPTFGPQPAMRVEKIGYGAGTRNSNNFPNVVRLSVGEADVTSASLFTNAAGASETQTGNQSGLGYGPETSKVTVLETALDDISPQLLAHVAETVLTLGAIDVMLTPVIMKKGRPGTLLTVLCNPSERPALEQLILRETTTLGIRIREDRRSCLDRIYVTVATQYGDIRMKIGLLSGEAVNAAPEFEDCRAAAAKHSTAVKQVQQTAIAAYLRHTATDESAS